MTLITIERQRNRRVMSETTDRDEIEVEIGNVKNIEKLEATRKEDRAFMSG